MVTVVKEGVVILEKSEHRPSYNVWAQITRFLLIKLFIYKGTFWVKTFLIKNLNYKVT